MAGKLLLFAAAPLMMLYAAFAGELGLPGGTSAQQSSSIQGPPVSCPDGRSFTSLFDLNGDSFQVVGALVSMEARTAVVAGPSGNVTVVLADTAPLATGLVVGEPAEASGSVGEFGDYVADGLVALCAQDSPTAAPTTPPAPTDGVDEADDDGDDDDDDDDGVQAAGSERCNRGPGHAGELRLDVRHRGVDLKRGTVVSAGAGSLTVDTLGGTVTVMITSDTDVKGDLGAAGEVRVKGKLDGDVIVAEKAWALCPDAAHDADNDGADADEEDGRDDGDGKDEDDDSAEDDD